MTTAVIRRVILGTNTTTTRIASAMTAMIANTPTTAIARIAFYAYAVNIYSIIVVAHITLETTVWRKEMNND